MTKRKSTPKVDFNSWLTGEDTTPTPIESPPAVATPAKPKKKASVKTIKKESSKVIKKERPLSAAKRGGGNSAESNPKIKATFHIDTTTAENLDAIQYRLKKLTGLRGHAISKSKILDTIMQLLHDEIEAEGQYSRLCQAIQAQTDVK